MGLEGRAFYKRSDIFVSCHRESQNDTKNSPHMTTLKRRVAFSSPFSRNIYHARSLTGSKTLVLTQHVNRSKVS